MDGHEEIAVRLSQIAHRWRATTLEEVDHWGIKPFVLVDGRDDLGKGVPQEMLGLGPPGVAAYGASKFEMGFLMGLRYAFEYSLPEWVKDLAT